jgi:hypothetical protein
MHTDTDELSPRDRALQEAIAAYLLAAQDGQAPDRSEVLAQFPDLAGELKAFFEDHDRICQVAGPMRTLAGAGEPAAIVLPQAFGDYVLVAEIGRGGMGVVYRAEQVHLRRTVALNMLTSVGAGRRRSSGSAARRASWRSWTTPASCRSTRWDCTTGGTISR